MKIADLKLAPPTIALYGEFGSGKTALALTLGKRLKMLSLEGTNLRVGVSLKDKFLNDRMEVDLEEFSDPDIGKAVAFEKIKARVVEIVKEVSVGKNQYQAICMDSLTALLSEGTRAIVRRGGKNPLTQNLSQPEWGTLFTEVGGIIRMFKAIPILSIMILHEQIVYVNDVPQRQLAIPGNKFYPTVPRQFDEIWYTKVKSSKDGGVYSLQCRSDGTSKAKSCSHLPMNLDQNLGMVEILRKAGYEFPSRD
jgi:hypothetical protein